MSRMIEVTVSPTGETTVQTVCFVGGDCLKASKFLEDALGVVVSERKTTEFFETAPNQQKIQQ